MKVQSLISKVRTLSDCEVYPPSKVPQVVEGCKIPIDLLEFYKVCGGLSLYMNSDYAIHIVSYKEFVLANPVIVGERCEYDVSSDWYIAARDNNEDYLTIDLNPSRLGRCYDSFWDRHGVPGECSIIATSFTDLLEKLINNKGNEWYWMQDDFKSLGDAYDGVDIE